MFPQKSFGTCSLRPLLRDSSTWQNQLKNPCQEIKDAQKDGSFVFQLNDYEIRDDDLSAIPSFDFSELRSSTHFLYTAPEKKFPERACVFLFGRTPEGWSCCVRTTISPSILLEFEEDVKIGPSISNQVEAALRQAIVSENKWTERFCADPFKKKIYYAKKFHGYHPQTSSVTKKYCFLEIFFPTLNILRQASKLFKDFSEDRSVNVPWMAKLASGQRVVVRHAESCVNPILSFLLNADVKPCRMLAIDRWEPVTSGFVAYTDVEVIVNEVPGKPSAFRQLQTNQRIPLRYASYDIECLSAGNHFPSPTNQNDKLVCIGTTVRTGAAVYKAIHALEGCGVEEFNNKGVVESLLSNMKNKDGTFQQLDDFDRMTTYEGFPCSDELDVIEKWADFLILCDADVLTGYNTARFDDQYIAYRAILRCFIDRQGFSFGEVKSLLKSEHKRPPWSPLSSETALTRAFHLSRLVSVKCHLKHSTFASRAHGSSSYASLVIPGIITMDTLEYVRKEMKLREYNLGFVSHTVLKDNKLDMPIPEMIRRLRSDCTKQKLPVLMYCVKDSDLPLRILDKLLAFSNYMEFSNIMNVFLRDLFARGQLWRVTSQLARFARARGFRLNVAPKAADFIANFNETNRYSGGKVYEPVRGLHTSPVIILDFKALYPSIIIANNLCNTTLLKNGQEVPDGAVVKTFRTDLGEFRFQQTPVKGVQPLMCSTNLASRYEAKKEMKKAFAAGNEEEGKLQNARQLAIKVSTNSIYGFSGTDEKQNQNACLPLAATVTCIGQEIISQSKYWAESLFDKKAGKEEVAPGMYLESWVVQLFQKHRVADQLGRLGGMKVVYGDTDSIMVKIPHLSSSTADLKVAWKVGEVVSAVITARFASSSVHSDDAKHAIVLEMENVYCPYLALKKKRYAGLAWSEKTIQTDEPDTFGKGILTERRDFVLFAHDVFNLVLDEVLKRSDSSASQKVTNALNIIRNQFDRLRAGEVDLEKLVMTRQLGSEYKTNTVIQDVVVKRMLGRGENAPQSGERVRFLVYFDPDVHHKDSCLAEKVDSVDFVKARIEEEGSRIEIDYDYYLSSFRNGVVDLLMGVDPSNSHVVNNCFDAIKAQIWNSREGIKSLDSAPSTGTKPSISIVNCADPYAKLAGKMAAAKKRKDEKIDKTEAIIKKKCRKKI